MVLASDLTPEYFKVWDSETNDKYDVERYASNLPKIEDILGRAPVGKNFEAVLAQDVHHVADLLKDLGYFTVRHGSAFDAD